MPSTAETLTQAKLYHQTGNLGQAEQLYRQIVHEEPNHAEVLHLLGILASQGGRLELAIECIELALKATPGVAIYHNNLGFAFQALGRLSEAAPHYRQAIALQPDYAVPYCNLGAVLQSQGQPVQAEPLLRVALRLRPNYPQAHTILGNALAAQGKMESAIACHHRALSLVPNFVDAHVNLGYALYALGDLEQAASRYQHSLRLQSNSVAAHASLGMIFGVQNKFDEAIMCYRRALQIEPENPQVMSELIHLEQHVCCWDDLESRSQNLITAVEQTTDISTDHAVSPFVFLALPTPTSAQQQLNCATQWVERRPALAYSYAEKQSPGQFSPRSKLTVGYLSADFHEHATSQLIAELIEKHDRERFAILGYSYGPDDGSPMRRRIANGFDRFECIKEASHRDAACRIRADSVDILVDLKGHTKDSRTQIAALRPAPIQVSYLGFPGTTGASFLDYIFVDDFVVPPDQQPYFSEQLVHLPGCYQVNDSKREIAAHTPSREEFGLPATGVVFCCFNNTYKICAEVFNVWMKLLENVPGSVLWLLEGNRFAVSNLRREAKSRGVSIERLVFAPRLHSANHIARYRRADLFLDTFPYNAHTTASEALWTGCPVLTLAGQTFASRVAGSMLHVLGLPELVTANLREYQDLALRLALDTNMLADLRTRLNASRQTSSLFCGERFARGVEQAYETMWKIYVSDEPARGFKVPADKSKFRMAPS